MAPVTKKNVQSTERDHSSDPLYYNSETIKLIDEEPLTSQQRLFVFCVSEIPDISTYSTEYLGRVLRSTATTSASSTFH